MRRTGQRGAGLAWALVLMVAVVAASGLVASTLTRRIEHVRTAGERAIAQDRERSARAVASARLAADPAWRGPTRVELAGAELEIGARCEQGTIRPTLRVGDEHDEHDEHQVLAPLGVRCRPSASR